MQDWYQWSITNPGKRVFDTLAEKYSIRKARVSKIVEDFESKAREYNFGKGGQAGVIRTITAILQIVESHQRFVPHNDLAIELTSVGLVNSPILFECIHDLAAIFNYPVPVQVVTVHTTRYIVPKNVRKHALERICQRARHLAQKYGGVYPYDSFMSDAVCHLVPHNEREHFIRTLLSGQSDYLGLSADRFFGFQSERERLLTQLQKIFMVYEEVSVGNLVGAMYRPIKKMNLSKGRRDAKLLEQCSKAYDEYCLKMDVYLPITGTTRACSPWLMDHIKQNEPSGKLLDIELTVVRALRANGHPMTTKEFMSLIDKKGLARYKSYFTESSVL